MRYELHVATGWASVAAMAPSMAHGSRWELVVSANKYWKLLCVPCTPFFYHSCILNVIFMLRFGPKWHLTNSNLGGASDVMHHATAAVLWLQCAIVFILCCVHVWVNLMNCGHHNRNLSLSSGCNERQVAAGWAFHVAQGHGPGWELEFWCQCVLRIAACM